MQRICKTRLTRRRKRRVMNNLTVLSEPIAGEATVLPSIAEVATGVLQQLRAILKKMKQARRRLASCMERTKIVATCPM